MNTTLSKHEQIARMYYVLTALDKARCDDGSDGWLPEREFDRRTVNALQRRRLVSRSSRGFTEVVHITDDGIHLIPALAAALLDGGERFYLRNPKVEAEKQAASDDHILVIPPPTSGRQRRGRRRKLPLAPIEKLYALRDSARALLELIEGMLGDGEQS